MVTISIEQEISELRNEKSKICLRLIELSNFTILQAKKDPKGDDMANEYYSLLSVSRSIDDKIKNIYDSKPKVAPVSIKEVYTINDLRAIHENSITSTTYERSQRILHNGFDKWFGARN